MYMQAFLRKQWGTRIQAGCGAGDTGDKKGARDTCAVHYYDRMTAIVFSVVGKHLTSG